MQDRARTVNNWVLIQRPIMDVYDFLCDVSHIPEWTPAYLSVDCPPGGRVMREGETLRARVGYQGFAIPDLITCVSAIPGRSVTFRSRVFAQQATYTFEPTSEGTLLTGMHAPDSLAFFGPFFELFHPWGEYALKQGLLQVKQRLEAMRFQEPKKRVFFNYRRAADKYIGGRVVERLSREFGDGAVFRDVDSIDSGSFEKRIREAFSSCKVVIVFIGPGWYDEFNNRKRQKDYVLDEIRLALRMHRQGRLEILPVFVDGAQDALEAISSKKRTVPELAALGTLQIHRLRPDPDFSRDVDKLCLAAWKIVSREAAIDRRLAPDGSPGESPDRSLRDRRAEIRGADDHR